MEDAVLESYFPFVFDLLFKDVIDSSKIQNRPQKLKKVERLRVVILKRMKRKRFCQYRFVSIELTNINEYNVYTMTILLV